MASSFSVFGSRYEMIQKLGEGSVSTVFLARDTQKNRECILKLLKEQYHLDEEAVQRFQFEFISIHRINHPNIIQVYELHPYYYTREYLAGREFRTLSKLDMAEILQAATDFAAGLEEIHRCGIIHRDLRPNNLRFSERGQLKILDFGFALTMDPSYKPLGIQNAPTLNYMSPELIKGYEIDPRSDIYSFGVILYELLTGRLPFDPLQARTTSVRPLELKPPSPRALNPKIPEKLEELILSCLDKDISKRIESATDILDRLRELSGQSEILSAQIERGAQVLLSPQFVHREAQLSKLLKFLDQSLQIGCEFVVITGEAGVGKSRLLAELRALRVLYEDQFFVLVSQETETNSFAPFIQMFELLLKRYTKEHPIRKKLVERYGDFFLSFCPGLSKESDLFRCKKNEKLTHGERRRFILSILQDLVELQFVGIFLENLQWSDPETVEVLEQIIQIKNRRNFFLAGTYLGDSVLEETPFQRLFYQLKMNRSVHEISLTNLVQSRLSLLIGSMLGQWKAPPPLIARLFHLTQGNPGLVEKIMRDLANRGLIYKKGGKIVIDIADYNRIEKPPELVDELLQRTKNLNPNLKDFLKVASALERKLDLEVMTRIMRLKESQMSLLASDLLAQGFLVLIEDHENRKNAAFGSLTLKEVTYQQIPEKERLKLHEAIGYALEKLKSKQKEKLARHFERAQNYKKAIYYYFETAQEYETRQRYPEAILFYEKTNSLLPFRENKKLQILILERLGMLYYKVSNYTRAIECYKTGLNLAEKISNPGPFYLGLGEVYLSQGDWKQAYNYFHIQYNISVKNKKTKGAYELAQMGYTFLHRDMHLKAEELFQEAIKISKELKNLPVLALSLSGLGEIYLLRGDWEQAQTTLQEAFQIAEPLANPHLNARILAHFSLHYLQLNQTHKAFKYMEDALYLADSCQDVELLIFLQNYFGELFESLGRHEKASTLYREALKSAEEHNHNLGIAYSCLSLGRALIEIEQIKEAKNYLLRSTTLYEHLGHQYGSALNYTHLGYAFLREGNEAKARSCFSIAEKRFLAIKIEYGLQKIYSGYGETLLHLNLREKAMKRLQHGLKFASQFNDRVTHGRLLHQLAHYYLLEQNQEMAEKYFREGLALLEFLPNRILFADGQIKYAQYLFELEKQWPQGRMESVFQFIKNALHIYQTQDHLRKTQQTQAFLEECESFYDPQTQELYSRFSILQEKLKTILLTQHTLRDKILTQFSQQMGVNMEPAQIQQLLAEIELKIQNETKETHTQIEDLKKQSEWLRTQIEKLGQERHQHLLMQRMGHLINTKEELEPLLRMILNLMIEVSSAERGFLLFRDETQTSNFEIKAACHSEKKEAETSELLIPIEVAEKTFQSGTPILIEDTSLENPYRELPFVQQLHIQSFVCFPFRLKERILGVFYFDHLERPKVFQKESLKQLTVLADQAAVAVENALLYQEISDKERIEQELNLASNVQKGLCAREIPQVDGLELAGMMQPARKVGGDYYDFIPYGREMIDLCIGDVTGKGIGAGLVMVMAKTALRILCDGKQSTKEILLKLNQIIYANTDKFIFMSFILFRWNALKNLLTYTGAGHEHILVYRAKTNQVERILSGGTVLGVKEQIEDKLSEKELFLFPGDSVLLYSDGVTEAMNPKQEEFGLDLFVETFQQNATKSPAELLQAILARLAQFRENAEQSDDITMVILQKK